ncbi:hypothetical protein WICMUC_004690 [Wickerhamomyces mucosus]|uniref:tRNA pseudouridine(32) synthase n=1 Tax=Wickerhamomyces mucosus TaxID=1378264 RepID=A0A9P8PFN3_9ASCO|nr:hypothetical protein WICMUC_004690 [Wickerhamomyces mucosus]
MSKRPSSSLLMDQSKNDEILPINNDIKIKKTQKIRTQNGFRVKIQDNHKDQINDENITYKFEDSLRKVDPYLFTYLTYCKERWRDRTLIDIFTNEFRDRKSSYYEKIISQGKVLVNNEPANLETIVRNGALINHTIHKHEPPVNAKPIQIVNETDELVVIDKPAGIPVHPTGRYRFNTITKIMKLEMGLEVHPCNRLDRLTSGLMFLAKNPKGAEKFIQQLKKRSIQKEYIARVKGYFPNDNNGEIIVCKPLKTEEPRLGLNVIAKDDDKDGKEATTVFQKINYDPVSNTSLVLCKPLTGRTHQIRVHLQYIGFPIANDPIYSNVEVWGTNLGKNAECDIDQVKFKLDRIGKDKSVSSWMFPNLENKGELLMDKVCEICETELYSPPRIMDLELWLHAYRYSSKKSESDEKELDNKESEDNELTKSYWSYETSLPDWAQAIHIPYMKLALDEALKCPPTSSAFSVGAILTSIDGEILSTGFSREIEGNTHAEQNALDKYFHKTGSNSLPKGCNIYTTMEPCSERLSGNLPCTNRLTNYGVANCFVGVMEPDTFVKNNIGKQILRDHGIGYWKIDGFEDEALKAAKKGHPDQ